MKDYVVYLLIVIALSYLVSNSLQVLVSASIYSSVIIIIGYYLLDKNKVLRNIPTKQWELMFAQFGKLSQIIQKIQLIQKLIPCFYRGEQQLIKIFAIFTSKYHDLEEQIGQKLQNEFKKLGKHFYNQHLFMTQYVCNSSITLQKLQVKWKKYHDQTVFVINYPQASIKTLGNILQDLISLRNQFDKFSNQISNLLKSLNCQLAQLNLMQQKIVTILCSSNYQQDLQAAIEYITNIKKQKSNEYPVEKYRDHRIDAEIKQQKRTEDKNQIMKDSEYEITNLLVIKTQKKPQFLKKQFIRQLNEKIIRNYHKKNKQLMQKDSKQQETQDVLKIPINKKGNIYEAYNNQ